MNNGLDPKEATETLKSLLKVGVCCQPSTTSTLVIVNDVNAENVKNGRANSIAESTAGSFIDSASAKSSMAPSNDVSGPTGVNLLQQLFATAANAGSLNSDEQIIELRGKAEGEAIPLEPKDIRIDVRVEKVEYLNNKIKIRNIVDLGWENRFTYGNQIAEHCGRGILAYTLKTTSGAGGVRVINTITNCRVLIRGILGQVADLAFAHIRTEVILAVVDDLGNLYVYQIEKDEGLSYTLRFQVRRSNPTTGEPNRVIWCKYIPDDFECVPQEHNEENFSKLLMVAHKNRCEFFFIYVILLNYGFGAVLDEADINVGRYVVTENIPGAVTEGSIAPEATTAAVATSTGLTKFYRLNMKRSLDKSDLQAIHEWVPHKGPISSLFFLDDHQNIDPNACFWEYVVTGADENRELKLWDCETWTCRQTICFDGYGRDVCLKACIDLSSNYIILSDLSNSILYIIQMRSDAKKNEKHQVSFASIAYFHLTFPVVSFTVSSVSPCRFKPMEEHVLNLLDGDEDDESKKLQGVLVKLNWLTTKSLQQCDIIYQPLKFSDTNYVLSSSFEVASKTEEAAVKLTGLETHTRTDSDTSSPSKEVADILHQTESEENGNNTSPEDAEEKPSPSDLLKACEKLQEQTQTAQYASTSTAVTAITSSSKPIIQTAIVENQFDTEALNDRICKNVTESISGEIKGTVIPEIQSSMLKISEDCKLAFLSEARETTRDAVGQVICPTFERISNKLFLDIANNMNAGFRQMLSKVETHFEMRSKERHDLTKKQVDSALDSAVSQMVKHVTKSVEQAISQAMLQTRDAAAKQISTELARYEKNLRQTMRQEVTKAVQEIFDEERKKQALMVASSPVSTAGSALATNQDYLNHNAAVLQEIKLHLATGDTKLAFSRALSMGDLDILMQTLKMVDRKIIFNSRDNCPLTPQVLIALIQQLSADISVHTQLKLEYLEDAMMTLNARDDLTRRLLQRILPTFVESLNVFLRAFPQHSDYRRVERLRSMAEFYTDRVSGS